MTTGLPASLDHLVYTVPHLASGMDRIERLLGVRPALGGRHPEYGSHNALLALGPATYLEVIAPDPDRKPPARGLVFDMDGLRAPSLATWALRTTTIDATARAAAAAGLDLGTVEAGSREKPNGSVLNWRLSDPRAMLLGGAVPFLIDWGQTPHPAEALPSAGELQGLRVEHPEPDRVRAALAALGVELSVSTAREFRLIAAIGGDNGNLELH